MKVEQFVTAYRANHDKIKALLNDEYESLRPVLRLNIEIIHDTIHGEYVRIEYHTPVASEGKRGWLNLMVWESPKTRIDYTIIDKHVDEPTPGTDGLTKGMATVFHAGFLDIEFTGVGIAGGCPAESDNDGCFYITDGVTTFVPSEAITSHKEYCDCELSWRKSLHNAMKIPIDEILGAYQVTFDCKS